MPYKKGPNGTKRFYDSSTGKYAKKYNFDLLTKKQKKTSEEKEQARRDELFNLAKNSKDKNLFEIYSIIEKISPGSVTHINHKYYDKETNKYREFDIMSKTTIYEIKSGKARHKYKQYSAQKNIADRLKKKYVVFSPNSSNYQINVLKKCGINIFNDIENFVDNERKKK